MKKATSNATTVAQQRPSVNLMAADIWFQDPEFAGLAVWQMKHDGMGDTLRCGDYALIDTKQTIVAGGGIFAILRDDGSIHIFQLDNVHGIGPTRRVICTYRNPSCPPPFEATVGEDVWIIGQVVRKIERF
jgi:hypothetical protein